MLRSGILTYRLRHVGWRHVIGAVTAAFAFTLSSTTNAAEAKPRSVLEVLRSIQAAAHDLDYAGVYAYQQGATLSASRIVHIVDGTGERERIEILDGTPREYIRHNDVTRYLIPERKTVLIEKRGSDRFPGLILGDGANIPEHYELVEGKVLGRVAGRECNIYELLPRDEHRYGYWLCADRKTGLLLKTQTISPNKEVLNQISFTEIVLGDQVAPEQLATRFNTKDWTVVETTMMPVELAKKGWRIPAPSGYVRVNEVNRSLRGQRQVNQLVMSDGLAAISVFIEPYTEGEAELSEGAFTRGSMNVFRTHIGNHWLTALGEVPPDTLRQIAESTEYVPLATQR